jgi:hypothetical protein
MRIGLRPYFISYSFTSIAGRVLSGICFQWIFSLTSSASFFSISDVWTVENTLENLCFIPRVDQHCISLILCL